MENNKKMTALNKQLTQILNMHQQLMGVEGLEGSLIQNKDESDGDFVQRLIASRLKDNPELVKIWSMLKSEPVNLKKDHLDKLIEEYEKMIKNGKNTLQ